MLTDDAPVLTEATVLRLQPGDALVFKMPSGFGARQYDDFVRRVRERFPGHTVVLLPGGSDVTVIRSEDIPDRTA